MQYIGFQAAATVFQIFLFGFRIIKSEVYKYFYMSNTINRRVVKNQEIVNISNWCTRRI